MGAQFEAMTSTAMLGIQVLGRESQKAEFVDYSSFMDSQTTLISLISRYLILN